MRGQMACLHGDGPANETQPLAVFCQRTFQAAPLFGCSCWLLVASGWWHVEHYMFDVVRFVAKPEALREVLHIAFGLTSTRRELEFQQWCPTNGDAGGIRLDIPGCLGLGVPSGHRHPRRGGNRS
jgi:hypothetical protein